MSDAGAEYLYGGLGGLGESIGAGIEKWKKEKEGGKIADALFKHLSADQQPVHPDQFATMSSRDKTSMMKGVMTGQAYQQGQADLMSKIAGTRGQNANANYLEQVTPDRVALTQAERVQMENTSARSAAIQKGLTGFNEDMAKRFDPNAVGPQTPMGADELFSKIAEHGLAMDPQADNVMGALGKMRAMQEKGSTDVTPKEVMLGGNSFAFSPKTGMMIPNPKSEDMAAQPIHDEEGNLLGHAIRNPKTGAPTLIKASRAGSADLLRYEDAFRHLDDKISEHEGMLKDPKTAKYADPELLKLLKGRRDRVASQYSNDFPDGSPAASASSKRAAPTPPGNNPTFKGGKLIFPK